MLDLYINVSDNSAPEFVRPLVNKIEMAVGETKTYKIPFFNDPEGNDVPVLELHPVSGYNWPPFYAYNNATRTITLTPNDPNYEGRTYHIGVTLREKNSDFMKDSQYIEIKMKGENPENFEKAKITMSIDTINKDSTGVLTFSHEVKASNIMDNYKTLFNIYVINTEKEQEELIDF